MGERSHAVAGTVVFVAFAAGAAIQAALIRSTPSTTARLGPVLLVPGLLLVTAAIGLPSLPLFLTGAALAGAGSGSLFRHALNTAASTAPQHARAEVLAGFFIGTYLGVSLPSVTLGIALQHSPAHTVMPYFAAVVTLTVIVMRHQIRVFTSRTAP